MANITPFNLKFIYTNREKTKFKLQFETIDSIDSAKFICTLDYAAHGLNTQTHIFEYVLIRDYTSWVGNIYESIEITAYTLHTPSNQRFGQEMIDGKQIRFLITCSRSGSYDKTTISDIIIHDSRFDPPYPTVACAHTPLYNEITDYDSYCIDDAVYGTIIKNDRIALEDSVNNIYSVSIVSQSNWNDFVDKVKYLRSLYIPNDSYNFRYVQKGEYLSADIFNNIANALIGFNVYLANNDFNGKLIMFDVFTHPNGYMNIILPQTIDVSVFSGRVMYNSSMNILLKLEKYYIGTINVINLVNRGETVFTDSNYQFDSFMYDGIIIADSMISSKVLS